MPSTTLLILGASGDLTSRLLLPALGQLLQREPDRRLTLLGASSDDWSEERWRDTVRSSFESAGYEAEFTRIADTRYSRLDVTDTNALREYLAGVSGPLIIYFALPPAVTERCCETLASVEIPESTILALEKPFGTDAESAHRLNGILHAIVPEERIFRVDHFLGTSALLNILSVRLANRIFSPIWNAEHVASVELRFDETLALENRARYYDHAGALVDMIQSHLLQVLGLIALEPPASLEATDFRSAKAAALRATRIWGGDPRSSSRRARYTAGSVSSTPVVSYVDEPGVDPARGTETYAEIVCEVQTERWAGVPFILRSGKALGGDLWEVALTLRPVRHLAEGFVGETPDGGKLTFSRGPDELRVELNASGNVSGSTPFELRRGTLRAESSERQQLAYAEVLAEMLDGLVRLSVRGDTVEQCWRIIQPVREAWGRNEVPLEGYAAGTAGPERLRVT
ncbi:MAG: glucose-6-phosphate dehydrogenase [Leucobacter sp.]